MMVIRYFYTCKETPNLKRKINHYYYLVVVAILARTYEKQVRKTNHLIDQ